MIGWLRRNPLIATLAVAAAALAAVIVAETEFGSSVASVSRGAASRRAAPPDAKLLPPVSVAAAEQAYPETTARPLFTPTRRPAPEAVAAPQSTFQKGQFVLQGVIAVGNNRIAMLREKSNGRIHRVEQGREVNGIKVTSIEPEVVTLAQGGEEEKLGLTVQKGPGVPGAPGQPVPPAAPPAAPAQGPFAAPAAPPVAQPIAPVPQSPFPRPGNAPMAAPIPAGPGAAGANPAARAVSDAGTALTPEELLARRRARRAQQTQ
jgi:hypothetical protein